MAKSDSTKVRKALTEKGLIALRAKATPYKVWDHNPAAKGFGVQVQPTGHLGTRKV